ncbi:4a-hydroxytetrahydrobiopterin dehydratase [Exiguobacterium flavidum]|uniref:4a-hydroxytetrahydrobiopterin dehydratase n=1 Tax=Exiguobacterium flavidum TaxID=2184695 RepID=UPI000DF7BD54|nr:4a-hydroxytetrahydrobiopterin dehydratase [Exiguobacterium flavidum]
MERLNEYEVEERLEGLNDWSVADGEITRTYTLDSFPAALDFVQEVGALAEHLGHHPRILIDYKKVTLAVTTHDAGGLTGKDFELAEACDAI